MRTYGAQSMVTTLRRVAVRAPDAAFGDADAATWHYTAQPDLERARREHDAFVSLLVEDRVEVLRHDAALEGKADSIFVHDPVLVTYRGTIGLRMGKLLRRGEEASLARALADSGVPTLGMLSAPATAEGGDLLWLDQGTLAVGLGFRTNAAAFDQLAAMLPEVILIPVPLPYDDGPDACLHLMSLISLVDHDLAVCYRPLLPVPFWQELEKRSYRFVDVPQVELATHGTNVLATAPGRCIMIEGNPKTEAGLVAAGCTVRTYKGEEITLKAEGGATCLTRPILRG